MRYTVLTALILLSACATGPSPLQQEWNAYRQHISHEVNAGRITNTEANYLLTRKRNELADRQRAEDAASAEAARAGLGMMQGSGPYRNTRPLHCTRLGDDVTCR